MPKSHAQDRGFGHQICRNMLSPKTMSSGVNAKIGKRYIGLLNSMPRNMFRRRKYYHLAIKRGNWRIRYKYGDVDGKATYK